MVTEDDYIGYLSRSPIEGHIPVQILDKLRESRHLFLGFGLRHWTLRVFLLRLWSEKHVGSKSWAVQRTLQRVEREFWERFDVDRLARYRLRRAARALTEPARPSGVMSAETERAATSGPARTSASTTSASATPRSSSAGTPSASGSSATCAPRG